MSSIDIGIGIPSTELRRGGSGAYDSIPNIVAAYGMRRLRGDHSGSLLRLRRGSDNVELDFGFTSNGNLDTSAIATWLGGGSGFIMNWYDQSGNGRHSTQTTVAAQPLYVASGQNGKPIIRFDGVDDYLNHGLSVAGGVLSSSFSVVKRNAGTPTFQIIMYANQPLLIARESATAFWGTHFGAEVPSSVSLDGVWKVISSVVRAHNDIDLVTNGIVENKTNGSGYTTPGNQLIGASSGAQFAAIDLAELIVCQGALSSVNRQAAEAAANSYWGIY